MQTLKHQTLWPLLALLPAIVSAAPVAFAQPLPYLIQDRDRSDFGRFRGVVTRVRSNREFDLRVGNDVFRVKADAYLNLRRGDFVDVRGQLRGTTLYADSVNRRDDNLFDNGGRPIGVDFRAEALSLESGDSLRVRTQDGRVYFVRTIGDLRRDVSRGDLVRVRGQFDGEVVQAKNENVRVVRDGAYPYGNIFPDFGRRVGFPATIRLIDRGELEVRAANRQTYYVRASNRAIRDLRAGDRVQIEGISRDGFIEATGIERVR